VIAALRTLTARFPDDKPRLSNALSRPTVASASSPAPTSTFDDDAIAEGLARTGGLISSAAAIMIAVFGAFMLGDFVLIKILGFALAVAVLVDATVVRIAIGPALLKLGGR